MPETWVWLIPLPLLGLAAVQWVIAGRQARRGAARSAIWVLAVGGAVSVGFAGVLFWVIGRLL
jgi:hypothetical protein